MITENLSTLKIHKLTNEQYMREVAKGTIEQNAIYLTPEEDGDVVVKDDKTLFFDNSYMSQTGGVCIASYEDDDGVPNLEFGGVNGDEPVRISGIATPKWSTDAANKDYVDSKSGTTYSLSKAGSTIILTGSDGSISSVEDNASNSTSSSGINREFNTGLINTALYTTTSNAAKIYAVTFKIGADALGNPLYKTSIFDYMACASCGNIMRVPLDDEHVASMQINSNKTVSFGISSINDSMSMTIAHICGYY